MTSTNITNQLFRTSRGTDLDLNAGLEQKRIKFTLASTPPHIKTMSPNWFQILRETHKFRSYALMAETSLSSYPSVCIAAVGTLLLRLCGTLSHEIGEIIIIQGQGYLRLSQETQNHAAALYRARGKYMHLFKAVIDQIKRTKKP